MNKKLITSGIAVALSLGAWTTAEASIDAPELWNKNCASCHGRDGKGETKAGKKAKVQDLTDVEFQKKLTDEKAFKSVKFGKKDGDREVKKPFESKLTDEEIKALVAHVRTFAKQ
jgi:cytochrome c553